MINDFEFIDKNDAGLKERVLGPTIQLYNKLSADETNSFRAKLNEIITQVNFDSAPTFPVFALKFKGEGNTMQGALEAGDIVHGFYAAGVIWEDAIYLGGDPTDKENYERIDLYITSAQDISLAKRKGDTLYGILDQYTGEEITLNKVTGAPTVDGIMYFELDGEYFKRSYSGFINVKWFGAKADNTNDDAVAINTAIQFIVDDFGGTLLLPAGIYKISSQIVMRRSVIFMGSGGYDYSGMPTQYGTCFKPTADFSDNEVIILDSAYDSVPLLSGSGFQDFAIDMDNISDSGKSAIVLRSVSNSAFLKNIVVNHLDEGSELVIEGADILYNNATDGINIASFFTYGKTPDYVSTMPKLLIRKNANEITFIGCKFQSKSGGATGTVSAQIESGSRGITFIACAFSGNETGAKILGVNDTDSPAEWIRFSNCTFETQRYGIYVDAIGTNPATFPRYITVEAGNRFITSVGADPRNVYLGKCAGAIVALDEFIQPGSSGTPYLCEITTDALAAVVYAQPTQVLNNSSTSTVQGRIGNSQAFNRLMVAGANGDKDIIIRNTAGTTANGIIRWQGSSGVDQAGIASNYNIGDYGALEFLFGNVLNAYLSSGGVFRLPALAGIGTRPLFVDSAGNLTITP